MVRASLAGWSPASTRRPLLLAVALGDPGAELLTEALATRKRGYDRQVILEFLGCCPGTSGRDEMRAAAVEVGRGSSHVRMAALHALARRFGADVTPELVGGIHDRVGTVAHMAMVCLADIGDARAIPDVQERLRGWLRRPSEDGALQVTAIAAAVSFLLSHLDDDGLASLGEQIVGAWPRLGDGNRTQLNRLWPTLQSRAPSRPEAATTHRWLEQRRGGTVDYSLPEPDVFIELSEGRWALKIRAQQTPRLASELICPVRVNSDRLGPLPGALGYR
jgi:hypothetical protein